MPGVLGYPPPIANRNKMPCMDPVPTYWSSCNRCSRRCLSSFVDRTQSRVIAHNGGPSIWPNCPSSPRCTVPWRVHHRWCQCLMAGIAGSSCWWNLWYRWIFSPFWLRLSLIDGSTVRIITLGNGLFVGYSVEYHRNFHHRKSTIHKESQLQIGILILACRNGHRFRWCHSINHVTLWCLSRCSICLTKGAICGGVFSSLSFCDCTLDIVVGCLRMCILWFGLSLVSSSRILQTG